MPIYNPTTITAPYQAKECAPNPCPVCGGLDCLCRPRFFAGQLLTEDDLNLLENYIIEKNKLHNRYLHGTGVVCGLEVICSPCQGQVTVTSGYAISPCGDDIVVCHNDTVNVCDLISSCKVQSQWNCDPPSPANPNCNQEGTEDWVLAIRYQERSSKGVMPLKNNGTSTCSRCGSNNSVCGGGSSCNCGCHSTTNGSMNYTTNGGTKSGYKTAQKATPLQCEPTVTCEGYVYEVYKAQNQGRGQDCGPFITRVAQCLQEFQTVLTSLSLDTTARAAAISNNNVQRLSAWQRTLKSSLQDLLDTLPIYDCNIAQQLANVGLPDPSNLEDGSFMTAFATATSRLVSLWGTILRYCLCSAILPPCPDPVHDPRIPLAKITVQRQDCSLVGVCNLDTRQFVLTFPTLLYWLSPILQTPLDNLHLALEDLCCQPLRADTVNSRDNSLFATNFTVDNPDVIITNPCTQLLSQISANRNCRIDTQTLVLGALGLRDAQGQPVMSELERQNPAAFLVLNQLAQPVLNTLLSEQTLRTFAAASTNATGATTAGSEDIRNLQSQVAELSNTLKQQQEIIDQLQNRLNG